MLNNSQIRKRLTIQFRAEAMRILFDDTYNVAGGRPPRWRLFSSRDGRRAASAWRSCPRAALWTATSSRGCLVIFTSNPLDTLPEPE